MNKNMESRIVGTGSTKLGKLGVASDILMGEAMQKAIVSSGLDKADLDGIIALPSMSHPRFMMAHFLSAKFKLLPKKRDAFNPTGRFVARTIDVGGAGPVAALLEAKRMIDYEGLHCIAVVAGDAVVSMDTSDFLSSAAAKKKKKPSSDAEDETRAKDKVQKNNDQLQAKSTESKPKPPPFIPMAYSIYSEWQMQKYGVTREQLAMVSVLMSRNSERHPLAMTNKAHTLQEVMDSKNIAGAVNLLECARRADGAACFIICSEKFLKHKKRLGAGNNGKGDVVVLGGGEATSPLNPPFNFDDINEELFSTKVAADLAFEQANVKRSDINWYGLYDCYPICFLRAVEAVGLAEVGRGGEWIEKKYKETMNPDFSPDQLPVNTHGGLLAFGAPWEAPAMFNIVEAVLQITKQADRRQVTNVNKALVYGNGGILTSSAVAILAKAEPKCPL